MPLQAVPSSSEHEAEMEAVQALQEPDLVGNDNVAESSTTSAPTEAKFEILDSEEAHVEHGQGSSRMRWPKGKGVAILPNAHVESRPFEHKYFLRRPQLQQYFHQGAYVDANGVRTGPENVQALEAMKKGLTKVGSASSEAMREALEQSKASPVDVQRGWLNLFIDLLWVGIVGNISQTFSTTAYQSGASWGDAFLEFLVLFITAWRIWNLLREFLNNFFTKDFFQSLLIAWILILALLFGNSAPFLTVVGKENFIVSLYLIVRASFFLMEGAYCYFLPKLRPQLIFGAILAIPSLGMLIGSIWLLWPRKAILIIVSLYLESCIPLVLMSPLGDRYLANAHKTAINTKDFVERLQSFFVIILGEGVFLLIKDSPLGFGIYADNAWYGIMALLIYYLIFWLFFSGDHTKIYLHAVLRNQYGAWLFLTLHFPLYSSLLLLDTSVQYLVVNGQPSSGSNGGSDREILHLARWTVSGALSAVLLTLSGKALLNRSFDPPKTLLVDSRYLRLAPRVVVCIVALCLPIQTDMTTTNFLAIIMGMLQALTFIEYWAGMERGASLFEPAHAKEHSTVST